MHLFFLDKQERILCRVSAGSTLLFCLRAADSYGNRHTTGGAVKAAIIRGAGKRRQQDPLSAGGGGPPEEGVEELTEPAARSDVICDVSYASGGCYEIKCRVFTTGTHDLLVSDSSERWCLSQRALAFGRVRVISGPPHGSSCKLASSNSYVGTIGFRHYFFMELFDEYGNHSHFSDITAANWEIEARAGSHVLSVCTVSDALREGPGVVTPPTSIGTSVAAARFVALAFTPCQVGVAMLHVRINHALLPACPVPFSIRISEVTLATKVRSLRAFLQGRHGRGYTSTLTMDRSRLLESAVQELQGELFSKTVRVRFGDERGLDMGGISKYVRDYSHLYIQWTTEVIFDLQG